jgi:exopolysaccharide production protein ExoY
MNSIIKGEQELGRNVSSKWVQLRVKRLFDILASLTGLILLAPVLLAIALLLSLTSPGPILFRQKRDGFQGREFLIWKFRSMRASQGGGSVAEESAAATGGRLLKLADDPRVTPIGRILRVTSLDELPQLFNVLMGDMSLVGPRPLVPFMLEAYPDFRWVRGSVRPGITGLWQIRDRENNTCVGSMMPHDLEYLERFSLALDAVILFHTIGVVISRKGAF